MLDAAIDSFAQARCAAESGIEQRLASVAELNRLYTLGLQAAIAGRSRDANPRLLLAAIQAEADARSKTPLEEAAHVAGLTIIAYLGIGATLQPRDLRGFVRHAVLSSGPATDLSGRSRHVAARLAARRGCAWGSPRRRRRASSCWAAGV